MKLIAINSSDRLKVEKDSSNEGKVVFKCTLWNFMFVFYARYFFPIFFYQINTKNDEITQLNCFLHYYSRFKNHENSYKVRT